MKETVGDRDRKARLVAGSLVLMAGIAGYAGMLSLATNVLPQALTSIILMLIGLFLTATGYTRKCPLYSAMGVETLEEQV